MNHRRREDRGSGRVPEYRKKGGIAAALMYAVLLGFPLLGCSPVYVLRAAYEEGKILWRREPITDVLHRPDMALETREKLRLVLAVREYARDVLKLDVGGSYAS